MIMQKQLNRKHPFLKFFQTWYSPPLNFLELLFAYLKYTTEHMSCQRILERMFAYTIIKW